MLRPFCLLLFSALSLPVVAQNVANEGLLHVQTGALLYVPGELRVKATGTLVNEGTVKVAGNATNEGVLTSAGLLQLVGTQPQTFSPGVSTTLAQLEITNSGAAGQNTVVLPQNLTIGRQLLLTSGLLRTDLNATLTLLDGADLVGEAPGRYVQGNLRSVRQAVAGSSEVILLGSLVLNPGGNVLGTVTVTRTAGLQTPSNSFAPAGANGSIDRIWRVESSVAVAAARPVTLTLNWLPDDDNGNTNFTQMRLWRAPAPTGPWEALAVAPAVAGRSVSGTTTVLGYFTASNVNNPLPVELVRFSADRRGEDALLRWATATEINNERFEVEVSVDGQQFRRIGTLQGQGSSSRTHTYEWLDRNLARYTVAQLYYRLRQVDSDGAESFSPVRSVHVTDKLSLAVQAWPSPFGNDGVTLTLRSAMSGPAQVQVHDATGRLHVTQTLMLPAGTTTLPLPAAGKLPVGMYVVSLTQQGQRTQARIVRQ